MTNYNPWAKYSARRPPYFSKPRQPNTALAAGQIAERLNLTTGAITNVIDRLERKDFVRREADAKDRRKVIVTVNQKKLAQGGNAYRSMGEAFAKQLQTYSTEQLEFLVLYSQTIIELTKQEAAKLATNKVKGKVKI